MGPLLIDSCAPDKFVEKVIDAALASRQTHMVVTANAQFYVLAHRNQRFGELLRRAEFVCADGTSIVGACRLLTGQSVPRIAGVDLISMLCEAGAPRELKIFLVGGKPGAAAETAALLLERHPGIEIVGVECPPLGFEQNPEAVRALCRTIHDAEPHVLLVALGAPKQEFFIEEQIRPLGIPIAVGVGGSFDIISGRFPRAPQWMQRFGLEWCFRFIHEPGRLWKRYLVGNSLFLALVLGESLRATRVQPKHRY